MPIPETRCCTNASKRPQRRLSGASSGKCKLFHHPKIYEFHGHCAQKWDWVPTANTTKSSTTLSTPAVRPDMKPRSCWWKLNPILAICKFFCMESVGFQQKERRNDERGLHSSPSRNESFSLIHNYQMAKQIPRGRWILRLIFLLHMFNKVNKDCEEIYVTQRRFSQHTKIQEWI